MCKGGFVFLLVICADPANFLRGDGGLTQQIPRFVRNEINAKVSGGGVLAISSLSLSLSLSLSIRA